MRLLSFVSLLLGLSAINAQVIFNELERKSVASTIANQILNKLKSAAGCGGCEVSRKACCEDIDRH
jgi:hypothetical protein